MKSRLADQARQALRVDLQRLTAEQRLAAYVVHCELVAKLRLAGDAARAGQVRTGSRNAG